MRVLVLTSSYPKFAGDSTAPFIESMTTGTAALGHEMHVVVPAHRDWNRPPVEGGVHSHPYRYSPSRTWTPWGYASSLRAGIRVRPSMYALAPLVFGSALRTCDTLTSEYAFDVVHAHWVVPNGVIGARVARRSSLPHVVSLHGSDVTLAERSRLIGWAARKALVEAQAVSAASAYVLDRARAFGVTDDALELLPYGVDGNRFRPDAAAAVRTRQDLGIAPDEIMVLGIGRLVAWKGFGYLLQATAIAQDAAPNVRVVIVGDGDLRQELEAKAKELGLAERAVFLGMIPHSDVPSYFAAADIVTVPSIHHAAGFFEALGNVALEALASATPVIASRVGGLVDVVRDGENGALVDEQDAHALAEAIVMLARDSELRLKLGLAGRRDAEAALSWGASAKRIGALYERVAGRR